MAKKNRYTKEEAINYIIEKSNNNIDNAVNILFNDKFLTYIANNTSVGRRYLYRIYYYVMYEKIPDIFPNTEVRYRKLAENDEVPNCEVDLVLKVEGEGTINFEFNKSISEDSRLKNDYYYDSLKLFEVRNCHEYAKAKDVIQINLDVKNRFPIAFGKEEVHNRVNCFIDKEVDLNFSPKKVNKKFNISIEDCKSIGYNGSRQQVSYDELDYLMSIFKEKDIRKLIKLYKERNDKDMMGLLEAGIDYYQDEARMLYYNKEEFEKRCYMSDGRDEGISIGRDEGISIGRDEGISEGRDKRNNEIIEKLIAKGYELEEISDITGVSIDELEKISKSYKNEE